MLFTGSLLLLLVAYCESFHHLFRNSVVGGLSRVQSTLKGVRNTIVFDIDETLCDNRGNKKLHPECIIKNVCNDDYLMYPHFKCLLELLLQKDCTVEFFSAGVDFRNVPLIESYLSDDQVLGASRYKQLKAEGQFAVYSRQHCKQVVSPPGILHDVKPLGPLLKSNQTLDNIILIDDYRNKAVKGEEPLIQIPNWKFTQACNTMYYLIGLFLDYFKFSQDTGLTMRQYFAALPKLNDSWIPANLTELILSGLKEVRKSTPEAVFYPGYWYTKNITMQDVVPSVEAIEEILIRQDTVTEAVANSTEGVDSGMTIMFKRHLMDYFVPHYRFTLSVQEKWRLPERVAKLIDTENEMY